MPSRKQEYNNILLPKTQLKTSFKSNDRKSVAELIDNSLLNVEQANINNSFKQRYQSQQSQPQQTDEYPLGIPKKQEVVQITEKKVSDTVESVKSSFIQNPIYV